MDELQEKLNPVDEFMLLQHLLVIADEKEQRKQADAALLRELGLDSEHSSQAGGPYLGFTCLQTQNTRRRVVNTTLGVRNLPDAQLTKNELIKLLTEQIPQLSKDELQEVRRLLQRQETRGSVDIKPYLNRGVTKEKLRKSLEAMQSITDLGGAIRILVENGVIQKDKFTVLWAAVSTLLGEPFKYATGYDGYRKPNPNLIVKIDQGVYRMPA